MALARDAQEMLRTVATAAALPLCVLGCAELPGEAIGTYRIAVTLEENDCGQYAIHRLENYSAQLRADDKRGYWRVPGQPPLLGKYDAPEFRFEYRALVAQSAADAGPVRCRLFQSEVLTGRVALDDAASSEPPADPEAPALEGEHELVIAAERGENCASALLPVGAFEQLPCTVRYSLRGKRIKAF